MCSPGAGVQFSVPQEPRRKGSSSASRKDKVRPLEGLPGKMAGQAGGAEQTFAGFHEGRCSILEVLNCF